MNNFIYSVPYDKHVTSYDYPVTCYGKPITSKEVTIQEQLQQDINKILKGVSLKI